jgi:hypothetical protein
MGAAKGGTLYIGRGNTKPEGQQSYQSKPDRESCRGDASPLGSPDSLLASGLRVYHQRGVSLSPRANGSSARWVVADRRPRMTTAHTIGGGR